MPRMKNYDAFKQDSLLLEFMKEHKGEENIVSSKEISKFLSNNGYSTKINIVHSIIKRIIYERNAPICYSNAKGYYWAKTKSEIERTIADMEMRRNALQEHINHLKNFIIG